MSTIRNYELFAKDTHTSIKRVGPSSQTQTNRLAFITLEDGFTSEDLAKEGVNVLTCSNNIAIADIAIAEASQISSLECVKALQLERRITTRMDKARETQQIDDILFGTQESSLPRAYTGKGVITGIVDQGFDPHHINFRYSNGESRISYLTWLRYNSSGNTILEDQYNYTNIKNFTTDDPAAYHGTHTLGIMAGSYNGEVTMMDTSSSTLKNKLNPYYGVAPEADIAIACGDLSDALIAYGINNLLDYKDFMQLPMVINLSLGSNSGPHDSNSAMAQFLSEAGKEAIICVSAGNEGNLKIALKKTFTAEDNALKTMIYPCGFQYSEDDPDSFTARTGSVEIWSEDDTPFEIKAVIYNKNRNYRSAYNMPVAAEDMGTYYCSSAEYMVSSSDIVGDPTFAKAFEGYVGVGRKLDEQTGRYYGLVDYYIFNNTETNLDDGYVLGFEVIGTPGQKIECYGDGSNTWMDSYGVAGFDDGSCNGSISDMAVAPNILVVGAYNSRDSWPCLNGQIGNDESLIPGQVSAFSSFGTLSDGRNLPDVCAPGSTIISSVSWPYAKQLSEDLVNSTCSAMLTEDNRVNYWKQERGTSMSTPFVAGTIALWLEANPNLTINDVRNIISNTSIIDEDVNGGDPVQWGAGKFNALGGLKEAIRLTETQSINSISQNNKLILTNTGRNLFNVFLGGAEYIDIKGYSIDGAQIMNLRSNTDETTINFNDFKSGIYILMINDLEPVKVVVK